MLTPGLSTSLFLVSRTYIGWQGWGGQAGRGWQHPVKRHVWLLNAFSHFTWAHGPETVAIGFEVGCWVEPSGFGDVRCENGYPEKTWHVDG